MKHIQLFEGFRDKPNVEIKRVDKPIGKIKVEDVMSLPEFISIEKETGYEMIALESAIKEFDFIWAFPSDFFIQKNPIWVTFDGYLDKALTIWKTVDLLNMSGMSREKSNLTKPRSKNNDDSIESWKNILKMGRERIEEWKKEFQDEGVKLLVTPEEKHQARGMIASKNFGI